MTGQAMVGTKRCAALREAEEILRGVAQKVEGGQRHCIWMEQGLVSYRLCTRGYECARCEFGQAVEEAGW